VLVALLSAALSLVLYSSTLSFEFVNWDDWEYVVFNPHLGELDLEFASWCLTAFHASNWHPATLFSFGLDHALWERDATGYHLTSVLLHAANSALVVWLTWLLFRRVLWRTTASVFGAAIVGLTFACHPLHVESVAWISERKDVLYGFFWLASLIAWLSYVDPDADVRRRRTAYALALASYALSALSKPMAVTLPLVLLILDAYPLQRLAPRRGRLRIALVEKIPFFAISIATALLTLAAQSARGAIGKADLSLLDRLWVAVKALGFYLGKLIAPLTLVPLYPLNPEIDPLTWPYWTALVVLIVLIIAAAVLRNRMPSIASGLAFYVATLLPVLGLVELGYHSAADRYMYIPMLGPATLAGAAAAFAWHRGTRTRWIATAVSTAVIAFFGWRTIDQISVWRDSVSLWSHVVAVYPDSSLAHYNLGHAHAIAGQASRAEAEWKRTLEIDSTYAAALYELGAAAGRNGEYAKALRYFEALMASDPNHARGRINLAMVLEKLGDWSGASLHYRQFIRIAPPELADYVELARSRLETRGADVR
jgi:tetratricopeptide (TPR) repeat protein